MFKEFVTYSEKNGIDFSINGLTLAFKDPETESNFNNAYFESSLQLLRACHLIAVFFYCLVGGWNVALIDASLLHIWAWVASVVTLFFLMGLAFTYLAPQMYATYWQPISALYVLMTGLGFSVVAWLSGPHYPVYNFVGVIFCLFFCYAFIRLSFVWATLAGNTIVAVYALSTGFFTELPTGLVMTSFFYMFGISLLGMMVCYSIELMARRDFMLQELLRREEKKTKDINDHLEERVKERTEALREANRKIKISFEREKRLVSELEKEEKKLQHSLTSLEQAESIGKLGYFERNWQSGERYWSKGFLRLLGYEKGQKAASHDTFIAFVHGDDRKRVDEHIQGTLLNHGPVDIEFRLVQKNHNVIQIHGIADNFYDHEDKPLATRGVFQDITDRRQAENALKKVEAQLIQAQKMESVGRLAGGVAHDYNNMLNIIMGHAEMAKEQLDPDDPLHENLSEILLASERSADITRQLLAFARKQTIEPEILDLNASVEKMLKMLKRLIGEDIELSWIPGTDLGAVKVDKSQVDQILANLCVNARDAIRGVGRITIETGNVTFDEAYCADHGDCVVGEFVMLAVSDNGIGMEKDTLDKVFEPFFTTKGIGEGTGLGLATVYGIAKQNDGFVNVYSEPEQGTAVKFYLPRQKASPSRMDDKHETELPVGKGETVLIVEDEPAILRLGRLILERQGYKVIDARSPTKAMELARQHQNEIELLITDVVMPEMNGRELAEQLKTSYPRLKTLFMSGYTANVIAHRGVIEDGVCFMPKPFSRKDMAFKVREVLDQTENAPAGLEV